MASKIMGYNDWVNFGENSRLHFLTVCGVVRSFSTFEVLEMNLNALYFHYIFQMFDKSSVRASILNTVGV